MSESNVGLSLHQMVLHLPVLTTLFSAFFCYLLFSRYRAKGGGPHLLWWGIGMATYGLGTLTEAWTTIFGWQPFVFRSWYVVGAFLGGYPLAQGSIYLLTRRRFANASAWIVSSLIAIASIFVFLTPLDLSLVEPHRLSGSVIEWTWIRMMTPFVNLYSVVFLVGGAVVSALRFRRAAAARHRYVGNILIAVGALLPGIGGALTKAGYVEALYVTELVGLSLIFAGYRKCVGAPSPVARRVPAPLREAATLLLALGLATLVAAAPAAAEEPASPSAPAAAEQPAAGDEEPDEEKPREQKPATGTTEDPAASFFATTTVTATGSEVNAFEISTPVTVLKAEEIERKLPNNAVELLREQPGVDINGVGPNQGRPIIRGQRGLRVLFLADGLRMNNARRQTDFGEIPGLVDMGSVSSVEVVRGPASVLYGTDAIGGVLNLITKTPRYGDGSWFGGSLGLRYGSAGEQERSELFLEGRRGRVSFNLGAALRDAEDYEAPAGSFGAIRLDREVAVIDTGIEDDSVYGFLGIDFADTGELYFRFSRYRTDQTGFGFVDPLLLGELDRIQILYPFQDFDRYSAGFRASAIDAALADSAEVRLFYQQNERELVNNIDAYATNAGFGPLPPGLFFHVAVDTLNFTDLETFGLRSDAHKALGDGHLLTYGVEYYEDDSFNTDSSVTSGALASQFAPGTAPVDITPPFFRVVNDVANTPNANNVNYGVFIQDEIAATPKLRATLGLRYSKARTEAKPTPGLDVAGLDFDDDAVVGSLNLVYGLTDNLRLVGSYGTAFRVPNIVERLFNGPTPEGSGFQILNPNLVSEESDNIDLGLKYLRRDAVFELVFFRNEIDNGIIQNFLSPSEIAALPPEVQAQIQGFRFVVQQQNIERLRYEGVEAILGYRTRGGLSIGGNYTYIDGKRLDSTNPPTGDSFSDKANLYLRYERPSGRWWTEYRLRYNSSAPANIDPDEPVPPVGSRLPSFTVHTLSGGLTLFEKGRQSHSLGLVVENLTDELYAEFSNATFFRPQAKRSVTASYRLRF